MMTTFNDIFKSSFIESAAQFSILDMALAMLFACAIGLFILFIYKKTFAGVMYSTGFSLSLLGLSMVTTLVILAVTSNIVLSLGMVGALSIVRFRSAIKDPMEIVFLFWSIASGIVIGAGMIPLAVLGSVVIGVILLIFANHKSKDDPYILILNCTNETAENEALDAIKSNCRRHAVKVKTVKADGIEVSVEVRLKNEGTSFVNRLQEISGMESAVLVSYNGEYMS